MVEAKEFQKDFYLLDDGRVRQFLFVGPDSALLVDAGFPDSHLAQVIREITDKPVQVVMTHGDFDHTGGLGYFGECWLHPADWALVRGEVTLHPLQEGDVFSCGEYSLEVVEIPGHTHGSVAFLDRAHRLLIPGDSVQQEGPIYLFGEHRDIYLYIKSLEKLQELAGEVDTILPCHHSCPIGTEWIAKDLEDAEALVEGKLTGEKQEQMPCYLYQGKWTSFFGEAPETYGN